MPRRRHRRIQEKNYRTEPGEAVKEMHPIPRAVVQLLVYATWNRHFSAFVEIGYFLMGRLMTRENHLF